MHVLTSITLENEMDLIMAHRRSMKLGELASLSLSAQTTFATAVSEVSRNIIEGGKGGLLVLSVENEGRDKYIVAALEQQTDHERQTRGLEFAKKLVNKFNVSINGESTSIKLYYNIPPPLRVDPGKLNEWKKSFETEPPISPYEELKRKNQQLQYLSEKVHKSESQYKTLTNSLQMIIFSMDKDGQLVFANDWLTRFTGETVQSLNNNRWKSIIHKDDYDSFAVLLKKDITEEMSAVRIQVRLKDKNGANYLWHQISLSPLRNLQETPEHWIGYMVDIHAQKVFEETLRDNRELKQTQKQLQQNQQFLEQNVAELGLRNEELQQFAYIASHDLQEPVRKLLFSSDYLINTHAASLDEKSVIYLKSMQASAQRMRSLIADLLAFSLINKEGLTFSKVDLNEVASQAIQDFDMTITEKRATITVEKLPVVEGSQRMLIQLFENIISNSLKFCPDSHRPALKISSRENGDLNEISFSDNGIGFDPQYLPKMFTLFQRLHSRTSYEGTGLGLAICRKITDIHGGKISAEGKEGEGSVFCVALPIHRS